MSPCLEVAHIGLATISWVEADLVIVHLVGDHGWDVRGRSTCTNVLTIATPTSGGIVGVDAARGDLSSDRSHMIIPGDVWNRGIVTVHVVRVQDSLLVV